jgi:hypothetical protein
VAKKSTISFKDSLDSLFSTFENEEGGLGALPVFESTPKPPMEGRKTTKPAKSFLGDLDEFFKETFEESINKQLIDVKHGKKPTRPARRTKPVFGIDNIIQSTVDSTVIRNDAAEQKITLTFDMEKLNRLNEIADVEKARIKDIIDSLIVQYIQEYEAKKVG